MLWEDRQFSLKVLTREEIVEMRKRKMESSQNVKAIKAPKQKKSLPAAAEEGGGNPAQPDEEDALGAVKTLTRGAIAKLEKLYAQGAVIQIELAEKISTAGSDELRDFISKHLLAKATAAQKALEPDTNAAKEAIEAGKGRALLAGHFNKTLAEAKTAIEKLNDGIADFEEAKAAAAPE